jgi:hypothetical protein
MKIPLSEQIEAVEWAANSDAIFERTRESFHAALSTLKWVERHQAELRVLAEFPGATVTVREVGK